MQILETGDLLISNVRESDAGLYGCIRANEAGTVFGEAYLGVMGKFWMRLWAFGFEIETTIIFVEDNMVTLKQMVTVSIKMCYSLKFSVRTQIIQPPADTRVLLGLTATLQCKVSSDPSVVYNIDWYRDSQSVPIMNSQRIGVQADGTLEIQAVRASDVGVYSCMVRR